MDYSDRLCFLSTDSMEISNQLTYNKNTSEVGGYCTLRDHEKGKREVNFYWLLSVV